MLSIEIAHKTVLSKMCLYYGFVSCFCWQHWQSSASTSAWKFKVLPSFETCHMHKQRSRLLLLPWLDAIVKKHLSKHFDGYILYHSSTLVSECLPVRCNLWIKEKCAQLTLLFKMLMKLKSKNEMQRETYMQFYPATWYLLYKYIYK